MSLENPLFHFSAMDKAIFKARKKEQFPLRIEYTRTLLFIHSLQGNSKFRLSQLVGEKYEQFVYKIEKLVEYGYLQPIVNRKPVVLTPLALSFIDSVLIEYRKVSARLSGEKKPLNKPKRKV